jgi:hypothetical protein
MKIHRAKMKILDDLSDEDKRNSMSQPLRPSSTKTRATVEPHTSGSIPLDV